MRTIRTPFGQTGTVAWLLVALLSMTLQAQAAPTPKVIECTADAPEEGKQILTIRMTPSETRAVDVIVVECVLRQTFPWTDSEGVHRQKTVEPVIFTWRQNDIKMVADLDCHLSLRVPVDVEELRQQYGSTTFVSGTPVVIPRITVTASAGGAKLWSVRLNVTQPASPAPSR